MTIANGAESRAGGPPSCSTRFAPGTSESGIVPAAFSVVVETKVVVRGVEPIAARVVALKPLPVIVKLTLPGKTDDGVTSATTSGGTRITPTGRASERRAGGPGSTSTKSAPGAIEPGTVPAASSSVSEMKVVCSSTGPSIAPVSASKPVPVIVNSTFPAGTDAGATPSSSSGVIRSTAIANGADRRSGEPESTSTRAASGTSAAGTSPDAVSCVAETKVVASGTSPSNATVSGSKPLPVIVKVAGPG